MDRTVADGARDAAADMNIEVTFETGQSTVGAEGLGQEEAVEAEAKSEVGDEDEVEAEVRARLEAVEDADEGAGRRYWC